MLLQEAIDSACAIDVNAAGDITSEDLRQFGIRNITLRDYQLSGVSWLASCSLQNRGAILCDEMGLGKTCQVIAFLSAYFRRKPHSSILLVCPLSVMDNWVNELNRFFPSVGFLIYSGDQNVREEKRSAFKVNPCPILLTTYELCINDQLFLETVSWDIVVVDEGHRLKNSDSLLYRVLSETCRKLRFILTGTPVQNNLTELYSLLHFVSPSHFPKSLRADFVNYFGTPDPTEQAARDVQMGNLLRPFLLRRTKQQVLLDLPPRLDLLIYHSLTPLQKKIYRALLTRNADVLTSVVSTEIGAPRTKVPTYRVTNLLMQLRKCVDHPYLFDDYSYERLDGSVRGEDRVSAVNCFNRSNETFAFLLSTKAGGQGLNLVAADTVIFIDSDFNPQNDIQAAARAHRIGQTKPVRVIRLVGRDTVEEAILSRADVKLKLTARVLGSGEMAVKGDDADTPSPEELATVLKFGLAQLLDNMNLHEVEDTSSLSDKPDLNFAEILGETDPDTWHWLPPLPVEAKLNSNKQSDWVLLTETPYQCKVSEADLEAVAQLKEAHDEELHQEQETAAVAEGYRIRSQGPVPPSSLPFEKRPKVGQKQLTPEELAEKKKKAKEAAERRLQKVAEAAAKRAERKLEKKKALWRSAGYLSMSIFREAVSDDQENPGTGTVLDAILVEDEANLNEEPETAVTIHYVFGDASEPLTNFEENVSPYRKPAIVCFSVDDSGGWARGGFFAALQKQSTKPREIYELAGEMDDLNMGDCHMIPVWNPDANINIDSTANMTFSDVLLLRDRETLRFPSPVNFCGLLIAQQHSRRSQTSGSPPDLHIDSLERSLNALGMACRSLGHCSVHLPRIGQGTHAFQWYTVERLLRKHLVERSHTDVYVYYYRRQADAPATATTSSSKTSLKRSVDDVLSDESKSPEPARKQAYLSRHLKNLFTGKVFYLWLDDNSVEESAAPGQNEAAKLRRLIVAYPFCTLIVRFYLKHG
ncbi:hypothetical protein CRM22_005301 [Opisthorchis felineus]|uniref:Helicase ATP-binding domain-containing protein n=1 Tax=Opisthorchis felineus TaxID=147828 RepID=A0A4S2LRX7_OPIFE|nr:hypothetical protein CRM22_005301 [Opisthorchis felineus]